MILDVAEASFDREPGWRKGWVRGAERPLWAENDS